MSKSKPNSQQWRVQNQQLVGTCDVHGHEGACMNFLLDGWFYIAMQYSTLPHFILPADIAGEAQTHCRIKRFMTHMEDSIAFRTVSYFSHTWYRTRISFFT